MANDNIFSGLKVVDLASFIAGPSAAVILSDFGADVVKVEPPAGEIWRIAHKIPPQPQAKVAYPWHLVHRFQSSNHIRRLDRVCKTTCGRPGPG
jgi:crotonobetainyl-CoA:carnitine CoA-transferase CaiB-like acyl-CoA transferase